MYKCGWNGCEKAYGTLNHLNAHVTMQSHGSKRTPEGMFLSSAIYYVSSDNRFLCSPFAISILLLICKEEVVVQTTCKTLVLGWVS
jgi:hypothetical protein